MVCYHSINSDNNNNIKGASIIRGPQARRQQETISILQTEINLVNNALNIAGFYIIRNPQQFQQPQEILRKVTEAFNIISSKKGNNDNSVKGASNNNICYKKEHLKDILNMFHL